MSRQVFLTNLRQLLESRFDNTELQNLFFDLGLEYDELPGDSKSDKTRELVEYLERRNRIPDLIKVGKRARDDIAWDEIKDDVSAPPQPTIENEGKPVPPSSSGDKSVVDAAESPVGIFAWFTGLPLEARVTIIVALIGLCGVLGAPIVTEVVGGLFTKGTREVTTTLTLTSTSTAMPTRTPTSTTVSTPTSAPSPTPTSLPQIMPAFVTTPAAFGRNAVRDIVAANGYVWFATDMGLVLHNLHDPVNIEPYLLQAVPYALESLALDPRTNLLGRRVWVTLQSGGFNEQSGGVGNYLLGEDSLTVLGSTPSGHPINGLVLLAWLTGDLWLGDKYAGIFHYTPPDQWELMPTPYPDTAIAQRVSALAYGPQASLWAATGHDFADDIAYVARYLPEEDNWTHIRLPWDGIVFPDNVSAIVTDSADRVWLAHELGLTVLAEGATGTDATQFSWLPPCSAEMLGLLPGPVWDLAADAEGNGLWVLAAGGLAHVNIGRMTMSNCDRWVEANWSADASPELRAFWSSETELKMAVDVSSERTILWLIKARTTEVLRLEYVHPLSTQ